MRFSRPGKCPAAPNTCTKLNHASLRKYSTAPPPPTCNKAQPCRYFIKQSPTVSPVHRSSPSVRIDALFSGNDLLFVSRRAQPYALSFYLSKNVLPLPPRCTKLNYAVLSKVFHRPRTGASSSTMSFSFLKMPYRGLTSGSKFNHIVRILLPRSVLPHPPPAAPLQQAQRRSL